jgi:hypothetical protein
MEVDVIRAPFYSSRHPEGRMFWEIDLIGEMSAKLIAWQKEK